MKERELISPRKLTASTVEKFGGYNQVREKLREACQEDEPRAVVSAVYVLTASMHKVSADAICTVIKVPCMYDMSCWMAIHL